MPLPSEEFNIAAQLPMTVGSLFILLRAAFCVSANLTVNESIVGKRYPYLQTADRQFWNFFDRGMLANCLQFWLAGNSKPDWALIYQREQQVICPRLLPSLFVSGSCTQSLVSVTRVEQKRCQHSRQCENRACACEQSSPINGRRV